MVKKHEKIVLTAKLKLELNKKVQSEESAMKLSKDYVTGIQTLRDTKNHKTKLLNFVRDCDNSV
jgi:hypothetical protein